MAASVVRVAVNVLVVLGLVRWPSSGLELSRWYRYVLGQCAGPTESEFKINMATASKSVRESGSLVPVAEHEWRSEGRQMKTAFRDFYKLLDSQLTGA